MLLPLGLLKNFILYGHLISLPSVVSSMRKDYWESVPRVLLVVYKEAIEAAYCLFQCKITDSLPLYILVCNLQFCR